MLEPVLISERAFCLINEIAYCAGIYSVMKKIIVVFFIGLFCKQFSSAQSYNSGRFTFCRQTGETITLADLKRCPQLIAKNKKLEVKSYLVAIYVPATDSDKDSLKEIFTDISGVYLEYKISGNKLTTEVLDYFEKHLDSHMKIIIDDVVALDKGKEGEYEGFVFYLH